MSCMRNYSLTVSERGCCLDRFAKQILIEAFANNTRLNPTYNERPSMRYFMYSPLDMLEHEALAFAFDHLRDNHIVHVDQYGDIEVIPPTIGQRPAALPNTYLVRVEQDDSTRVVDKKLN